MFETLGYWMNRVFETKNPLNEWNVILIIMLWTFSKSQKL
jgi:hypothetical protein